MSRADNKEKYKEYDHQYYIKHKRPKSKIGQAEQQISDLEAKLEESEKKYAELFCRNIELETLYSQKTALLNFYKDTDLVEENQQLKQSQKQLAIEELERVKELLDECKWFQGDNEYSFVNDYAVDWDNVVKIFDNQIKQLKEGK